MLQGEKEYICRGDRTRIRELTCGDAQLLYEYSREKAAAKELPDEVQGSVEEAGELIEYLRTLYPSAYPLVYGIEGAASGLLAGHIGLSEIPEGIEVGYAVSERFRGNSLCADALAAFIPYAMERIALDKIYAVIKADNIASVKSACRAGAVFACTQHRDFLGTECETLIYIWQAQ